MTTVRYFAAAAEAAITVRRSMLSDSLPNGHCSNKPPSTSIAINNDTSLTCMPSRLAYTAPIPSTMA